MKLTCSRSNRAACAAAAAAAAAAAGGWSAQEGGDDFERDADELGPLEVGGALEEAERPLEQEVGVRRQRGDREGQDGGDRAQRCLHYVRAVRAHRALQQRQQWLEQRHRLGLVRKRAAPQRREQQREAEAEQLV